MIKQPWGLREAMWNADDVLRMRREDRANPLALQMLVDGAVRALGSLSLYAEKAAGADDAMKAAYVSNVRGLVEFCEEQGHPAPIKEWSAMSVIQLHFPECAMPEKLSPKSTPAMEPS